MALYDIDGNVLSFGVRSNINQAYRDAHLIAHKRNTVAQYQQAVTDGYKIIEVDVRFTSDSIPVLSHDTTVGGYTIASYTYVELSELYPSIAKLYDFLAYCKLKGICPEVDFTKEYSSAQCGIVYQMLADLDIKDRTMITTYEAPARTFAAMSDDLIICLSQIETTSAVDSVKDLVGSTALLAGSIRYQYCDETISNYMHNAGMKIKAWTLNDSTTARAMFDYGTDYIITDTILPSALS